MSRIAFTLIELLIVLAIVAILMSLVTVGMGNVLHQARVQTSASAVVQTFVLAQQMASSNRRVYTLGFNSARAPGTAAGMTPLSWDATDRYYARWGGDADLQHNRTTWTAAPLWSDLPEDQWYALMGPWQDEDGRWYQVRGGMPRRNPTTNRRAADCSGYGDASDQQGGAFGPPTATASTAMAGAANTWDNGRYANPRLRPPADWPTAWRWDPYGVQVGQRRFLSRGTRWAMCLDVPEWTAMGSSNAGDPRTSNMRNYGLLTLHYDRALPAHHVIGRSNAVNENARTTGYNVYPNAAIDRNQCPNVESFMPCGQAFDQTTMSWLGIASTATRPMTFQPYLAASGLPDTSKALLSYNRPVVMLWLTVYANGDVIVSNGPRKGF